MNIAAKATISYSLGRGIRTPRMKKLGYSLTWPTTCFLGCAASVWAHTNGDGDFVLLDSLGSPWPIHPCYETRSSARRSQLYDLDLSDRLEQLLANLDDSQNHLSFQRPAHVSVVDPAEWVGRPFVRRGLVEFYRERRLEHFIKSIPAAELAQIKRIFGDRKSELAIVDRNGNLFAIFVDLHDTVVSAGDLVEAEIGACRVPIKRLGSVFLCHSLKILPQSRPKQPHLDALLNALLPNAATSRP